MAGCIAYPPDGDLPRAAFIPFSSANGFQQMVTGRFSRQRPVFSLPLGLILVSIWSFGGGVKADELPEAIRIATWNVEWFFDDFTADNRSDLAKEQSAPSRAEWEWKLEKTAGVIARLEPTIIALQEVENRDVLYRLVKELKEKHQQDYKYCFIDGFDFGTEQNVAFLYQNGLVEYARREQTQEMFDSQNYYNLSKHLIARFEWGDGDSKQTLQILTLHLRAAPEQEALRVRQGRLAHEWMKEAIAKGDNVLILGDLNTEHPSGHADPKSDIGVIRGLSNSDASDDLEDLNRFLPDALKSTHLLNKEFDRILASPSLMEDTPGRRDLVFSRIITRQDLVVVGKQDEDHFNVFYSIPREERDVSDHYPVMTEFLIK